MKIAEINRKDLNPHIQPIVSNEPQLKISLVSTKYDLPDSMHILFFPALTSNDAVSTSTWTSYTEHRYTSKSFENLGLNLLF